MFESLVMNFYLTMGLVKNLAEDLRGFLYEELVKAEEEETKWMVKYETYDGNYKPLEERYWELYTKATQHRKELEALAEYVDKVLEIRGN